MSQSIAIRREGDLIVLEDIEDTPDHRGVLKSTVLDPDSAIRLFEGGLVMARLIKREAARER